MTTTTVNPATSYLGTTWELLPENKYLKTGSTPLQQGGSNSITIQKANLPATKLQVESFSLSISNISGKLTLNSNYGMNGANTSNWSAGDMVYSKNITKNISITAGNTSSASPYTTQMGNGTAITINPEHITVRAWKRLS